MVGTQVFTRQSHVLKVESTSLIWSSQEGMSEGNFFILPSFRRACPQDKDAPVYFGYFEKI